MVNIFITLDVMKEPKIKNVNIRLSESEQGRLLDWLAKKGLSISSGVRMMILDRLRKDET